MLNFLKETSLIWLNSHWLLTMIIALLVTLTTKVKGIKEARREINKILEPLLRISDNTELFKHYKRQTTIKIIKRTVFVTAVDGTFFGLILLIVKFLIRWALRM